MFTCSQTALVSKRCTMIATLLLVVFSSVVAQASTDTQDVETLLQGCANRNENECKHLNNTAFCNWDSFSNQCLPKCSLPVTQNNATLCNSVTGCTPSLVKGSPCLNTCGLLTHKAIAVNGANCPASHCWNSGILNRGVYQLTTRCRPNCSLVNSLHSSQTCNSYGCSFNATTKQCTQSCFDFGLDKHACLAHKAIDGHHPCTFVSNKGCLLNCRALLDHRSCTSSNGFLMRTTAFHCKWSSMDNICVQGCEKFSPQQCPSDAVTNCVVINTSSTTRKCVTDCSIYDTQRSCVLYASGKCMWQPSSSTTSGGSKCVTHCQELHDCSLNSEMCREVVNSVQTVDVLTSACNVKCSMATDLKTCTSPPYAVVCVWSSVDQQCVGACRTYNASAGECPQPRCTVVPASSTDKSYDQCIVNCSYFFNYHHCQAPSTTTQTCMWLASSNRCAPKCQNALIEYGFCPTYEGCAMYPSQESPHEMVCATDCSTATRESTCEMENNCFWFQGLCVVKCHLFGQRKDLCPTTHCEIAEHNNQCWAPCEKLETTKACARLNKQCEVAVSSPASCRAVCAKFDPHAEENDEDNEPSPNPECVGRCAPLLEGHRCVMNCSSLTPKECTERLCEVSPRNNTCRNRCTDVMRGKAALCATSLPQCHRVPHGECEIWCDALDQVDCSSLAVALSQCEWIPSQRRCRKACFTFKNSATCPSYCSGGDSMRLTM